MLVIKLRAHQKQNSQYEVTHVKICEQDVIGLGINKVKFVGKHFFFVLVELRLQEIILKNKFASNSK